MRTVPEWIASHDDQAIPDRVKDRIAQKARNYCAHCDRQVGGKLRPHMDHIISLILGGRHRELNLQLLCHECHAAKTKLDVKLKGKVTRVRLKNIGFRAPRQKIQSRGFAKAEPQRSASRPISRAFSEGGST